MITIFTTCRPLVGEFIAPQYNAIRSWQLAVPGADIILMGDDQGTGEAASELGVRHIGGFDTRYGKPYIRELWTRVQERARYETVMYINADIILLNDFLPAAQATMAKFDTFLAIGQRTDITIYEPLFSDDWEAALRDYALKTGELYSTRGIDYFLWRGDFWGEIPPAMLIACTLWDNWLVWRGLDAGVPVIDMTKAVLAVHQLHPGDMSGWDPKMRGYNQQAMPQPWSQFIRGTDHAPWELQANLTWRKR